MVKAKGLDSVVNDTNIISSNVTPERFSAMILPSDLNFDTFRTTLADAIKKTYGNGTWSQEEQIGSTFQTTYVNGDITIRYIRAPYQESNVTLEKQPTVGKFNGILIIEQPKIDLKTVSSILVQLLPSALLGIAGSYFQLGVDDGKGEVVHGQDLLKKMNLDLSPRGQLYGPISSLNYTPVDFQRLE